MWSKIKAVVLFQIKALLHSYQLSMSDVFKFIVQTTKPWTSDSLSLTWSQYLEYLCFYPVNSRQTASFSWQAAPSLLDFQSDNSLLWKHVLKGRQNSHSAYPHSLHREFPSICQQTETVRASKKAAEEAAISFLAKVPNETEMGVYFASGSLGWHVKLKKRLNQRFQVESQITLLCYCY